MRTAIGASLPIDLYLEFVFRDELGFPGGKTGLMKEALRNYFATTPLSEAHASELKARLEASQQTI